VLRGASSRAKLESAPTQVSRTRGRRLAHAVVRAKAAATALVAEADARARTLLQDARAEAERHRIAAVDDGRSTGLADAAALALALRIREERADEASLDRIVGLARLLAERLLGQALDKDDGAIGLLARQAIDEARGARRITLRVHPSNAAPLESVTLIVDPKKRIHAVVGDATLERGDVVLETDLGTVDARLGTSLDRLTARLKEAIGS
jgi:flagellar biosynthesis/type III secretory pathway protein FliH